MRALKINELDIISGGEFDLKGIIVGAVTGAAAASLKWYQGSNLLSSGVWGAAGFGLGAGAYYGGNTAYRYLRGE